MTTPAPRFFPLQESTRADVCIVGAGIAGLSTAYLLAREGKSVIVLDDGPIGGGETERTTAHLSNAFDDRYLEVERLHGERGAQLVADSHTTAIARIEENARREKIGCDFQRVDGFLFVPPGESTGILEHELQACHRAGLMDVEWVDRAPIPFDTGPCLRFPRQGQFHPMKYLAGLTKTIVDSGGRIYCNTQVVEFSGGPDACVRTSTGQTVRCDFIVVATNTPVNDLVAIHTKQAPYRTYVIGARVASGLVRHALYWDTESPYHYVRTQTCVAPEGDIYELLIVGGEDHKTAQPGEGDPFARLELWTRERFPISDIEFRWSGQVMEPNDGLAFIGRNPLDKDNVFICTGDSGQGMTHGTIASMLLTDLILGRPNEWERLYDPGRITLKAAGEFLRENLNVARKYGEWLLPGEVQSVRDIVPGAGGIVRRGMQRIAAYRDETGKLHEYSAVCRHLGCIVHWNSVEKTWDCPCHGSRYDRWGKVVTGPALDGLKSVEVHSEVHA